MTDLRSSPGVDTDDNMTLNIAIGIPTVGRAKILCKTLQELSLQTRQADAVFVCAPTAADVAGAESSSCDPAILLSGAGASLQRNAILSAAKVADIVVFFDDDFLPGPDYLATVERHMTADPRIVVATGHVIADGIKGPGLSFEEGRAILAHAKGGIDRVSSTFSGYGCNMAVRMAPARQHGIRFDERLPLYSWQEDVDLSRRLAAFGSVVALSAAQGVHLGAKQGRGSGVRLGYSQVANPLYLYYKRCGYPLRRAWSHILCNMAMNAARAARPEPYVDRRGRLFGNMLALRDVLTGRLDPERILQL